MKPTTDPTSSGPPRAAEGAAALTEALGKMPSFHLSREDLAELLTVAKAHQLQPTPVVPHAVAMAAAAIELARASSAGRSIHRPKDTP